MKIFDKPEDGWVVINVGEDRDIIHASYITDIPMDFLNAVIANKKYDVPFSVYVDEEGQENVIYVYYEMMMVTALDGFNVRRCKATEVDGKEFMKAVVAGIEEYFEDWVEWFMEDEPEKTEERRKELRSKLDEAKELIK